MADPDIDGLRLLVLIGEVGSLGRAAARLGISQPAASKRLGALERRLRLVLVDRGPRGSELTPTGHAVVAWAERVLAELDALVVGAAALRGEQDNDLDVAASMTIAEYLAPAWIGALRQRAPGLYVRLQVTNSEHVAALAAREEVGIGFLESPTVPAGLASRRVAADRLSVVVAVDHPWARRRTPVRPDELARTPLIVRERGSGTRDTLDRALRRARTDPVRPLLELGSSTAVRSAVAQGAGPAVLSALAVAADVADGRLVEVTVEGIDLRRTLRAVWPARRRLGGAAAALLRVASAGRT
jgi:DNA-binding transcriptional LysR family regulator